MDARLKVTLFILLSRLLAMCWPLFAQAPVLTPAWHAGVAKVTVRADLNRLPGTAFVVALEEGTAFLVTSAHVGLFSRNHYYVIVRRPDGILIRSRHQGSGGVKFVPHSDMWLPR